MRGDIEFVEPDAVKKKRKKVLSDDQLHVVKLKLTLNPVLGDLIEETGGARKVWALGNNGQSRLIYYYHQGAKRIFFLAVYPKSQKKNLSQGEKKELKAIIKAIKTAERGTAK